MKKVNKYKNARDPGKWYLWTSNKRWPSKRYRDLIIRQREVIWHHEIESSQKREKVLPMNLIFDVQSELSSKLLDLEGEKETELNT